MGGRRGGSSLALANPGRMVGDLVFCTRCGCVLGPDGATVCEDCSRLINRFTHGTTYIVVSDPTGTYDRLGHHKDPAFEETLRFGFFPEGMVVEVWKDGRPKHVARVDGPTCPPDLERSVRRQLLIKCGPASQCQGDRHYLKPGRRP